MGRVWTARFAVFISALGLVVAFAPAAMAQGGLSTPGVIVTAENPGIPGLGGDFQLSLTAHTEQSAVENPSCRPQDLTLRCWGSLYLRVPARGGMIVTRFHVHRVAVGDISCGGEEGGGCGDEGGGCEEGGSCEGGGTATPALDLPEEAQVNGVAVLTSPGNTGLSAGTQVQVMITLTDKGTGRYASQADVQVNEFVPGPVKPGIYDSGTQDIQQVQIHMLEASG